MDVIQRLEPVIIEMERTPRPLVIIAHQAVIRCLFAYFEDLPKEKVPYEDVPLHHLMKVTAYSDKCVIEKIPLNED